MWKFAAVILPLILSFAGCAYIRATHTKQVVESAENLRELQIALLNYANENRGHFPEQLSDLLVCQYAPDPQMFIVPWGKATPVDGKTPQERAAQMAAGGHCSYGYLGTGRTMQDMTPDSVLMYEAEVPNPIGSIFCLMGDGHGESFTVPQAVDAIVKTLKQPPATTNPTK